MPDLLGVSHISITVTDLAQAKWFWAEVMGFELAVNAETMFVAVHRNARLGINCRTHDGASDEPFDERRVGLDHLALSVKDVPALESWEERLRAHDVEFTSVTESEWGWHLNVRAPENIAVELEVTKPEVAIHLFGRVN
ncbi:MAG TPA: VOC family protein [Acidimicrobiales bacterium]|jgi:catechol 2,3-dioxygenase-like lactoylglutathione lyase family enzyme